MKFGRRNYKIRCYCCDKILSDYERSIKNVQTGDYEDTCLKCLQGLNIRYKGNTTLLKKNEDRSEEMVYDDSDLGEYKELFEDYKDDVVDE
jgi:predicted transcriptional regulator with HTH domain